MSAYDAAGNNSAQSVSASATTQSGVTSGAWPGQSGNPVGYAAYSTGVLGTTPWPGGAFVSGTASSPTIYQGYAFSGPVGINCSYCKFISDDFNSGTAGVIVTGSNVTFIGDRFQSNASGNYNVQINGGSNVTFSYDSFTPLATFYTSPPGKAWPSAGANQNTTNMIADVNSINGNSGYQTGISFESGGPLTVDHCDFWGFGNSSLQMLSVTAQLIFTNNWVHDAANQYPQNYHIDGIGYVNGMVGPNNELIQGNTIASLGNTNAIAYQAATGGYSNIQIIGNYLSGFGFNTAAGEPSTIHFTNSSVKNNVFSTSVQWIFGPVYGDATDLQVFSANGNAWSGNTFSVIPGTVPASGAFPFGPSNNGYYVWPDDTIHTTDFSSGTTGTVITPPSAPTNVAASAVSSSQINLSWNAAAAGTNPVSTYIVYRNGTQLTTVTALSYADTGLVASTAYSYTIAASDSAGNASPQSASVSATTQAAASAVPPRVTISAPSGQLAAGTTQTTLSVTTDKNATCVWSNVAGTAFASMAAFPSVTDGGLSHSATLAGLSNGASYIAYVKCKDTAGNISTDSSTSYSVAQPAASGGGTGIAKVIVLTSGTSWTVPADWNSSNNTIEAIGGGAGGASGSNFGGGQAGGGGGGGAYAKVANVTLAAGSVIGVAVGSGGTGGASPLSGGDTYFNGASCASSTVCSKGGSAPTGGGNGTGGAGGAAGNSVGSVKNSGGTGGSATVFDNGAPGGGGAGGPRGAGAAGGAGITNGSAIGGAGGGGADGGTAGGTTSVVTGASGGGNGSGVGAGGNGSDGNYSVSSANGSSGTSETTWTSNSGTAGPGGGGGGAGTVSGGITPGNGGNGALYGGGGAGGPSNGVGTAWGAGGNGGQGIIVITYTP